MSQATEKLLHIIRSGDKHESSTAQASPTAKVSRFRIPRPWTTKSRRLGVDIAPRGLRLMLVADTEAAPKILGFRDIAYPEGANPGSAGFPAFLRREVKSLCGRTDDLKIWSHVFSFRTQLQHILVPKVPPWELYDLVYWRVKRDNPFDDKEFLLDFKVQGQIMDKGAVKHSVICCVAPRKELALTRSWFVEAGLPLAGLTPAPLALQAMFRHPFLHVDAPYFATLQVEQDWSRIDIFADGNLVMSRLVKTGLSSMADTLVQHCNERLAGRREEARQGRADAARGMVELDVSIKDDEDAEVEAMAASLVQDDEVQTGTALPRLSSVDIPEDVRKPPATEHVGEPLDMDRAMNMLIQTLANGRDVSSIPWEAISDDQIFEMIAPVCERLAKQVERTFAYNTREQNQERTELLLISGDLAVNVRMREVFWGILGVPTQALDPLDPEQQPKWGPTTPPTQLDRIQHNLALALALCTPGNCLNLQATFHQHEEARSVTRVNMAMFVTTIILLLALSTVYMFQGKDIAAKQETLAGLDRELTEFTPRLGEDMLMRSANEIREQQEELRSLSARLQTLAMLREVAALTPEHIRLFNVRVDGGARRQADARARSSEPVAGGKALVMDGMIVGDPMGFETALAGYIIALQRSPLFEPPQVHDKRLESGNHGEERMRFVLHLPMHARPNSSSRLDAVASRE
ncbi:hypothetical protein SAMN06295888_13124 [Desulfonatronum zhilinae]|nr:hypothetical protein SAMN06295888_13124 [Desulfonatronum zhilinae]